MTADARIETSRLVSTFSDMVSAGAEVELRSGTVLLSGNPNTDPGPFTWTVSSGGIIVNAIWNQGLIPYQGAACTLALATLGNATTYYVVWVSSAQPNNSGCWPVTAFTAGSPTCTITVNGNAMTAHRAASYTPTVGDVAVVLDMGGQLRAICPMTVYTPPPPPPAPPAPPPPPAPKTGNSFVAAQDSGTWTATYGGWNSYYGQNVYSGSGYVPTSTGAWFYNGGTNGFGGKTITALRFWLPPRRQAGAWSSGLTAHLYAHNSTYRGGEPTRFAEYDVFVPAYFGGGWVALPGSFFGTVCNGGGISIAGDPYIGFTGVGENGSSGALSIDWSF